MTITGADHIVIAVQDLEQGIAQWRDRLGLALSHRAELPEAGLGQAFFTLADGTFIELIAPLNSGEQNRAQDSSTLDAALASRGEGVHVVALQVDDLDATVASLQAQGVKLIGVGTPQVFIHPKDANGVMIQLWPKNRPHRWRDNLPSTAGEAE